MQKVIKSAIFLIVVALLAAGTFSLVKPLDRLAAVQDETRLQEIEMIVEALEIYADINEGTYPRALENSPTVELDELETKGIPASDLVELVPDFLSFIPQDPHGQEYRVGWRPDGHPAAGIRLSTGEFTIYPVQTP